MLHKIGEFIDSFFNQVKEIIAWLLDGLKYIVSEIFYVIYDKILSIIETLVTSIDFSGFSSAVTGFWSDIPGPILYTIGKFRLAEILAILAIAYGIRLLLNLVPAAFTRV